MKQFLCIVLLSYAIKSSHNCPNCFIPEKFRYPAGKIGGGKTFTYQNSSTNQLTFRDLRSLKINGQHFQIVKSYNSVGVSDSIKLLNGKAIEIYNFFINKGGDPIKAENIHDTVINREQGLGIYLSQERYQTNELIYITSSKEKFSKDTFITWEGNQLPCLVTQGNAKVEIKVKADTSVSQVMEIFSISYYAKGIGVIQYSSEFTDHTGKYNYNLWKLKSIRDIK